MKPVIYCRYVDDIFVVTRDQPHLDDLKRNLENSSVLTFTSEISVNNKIPFLDVDIDGSSGNFTIKIYRKSTDKGKCLNALSECPNKYKSSVVKGMIRRALKICSFCWELFHLEILNIKQLLVNNSFSNKNIEEEINTFLSNQNQEHNPQIRNKIKVFYIKTRYIYTYIYI